MSEQSLQLLSRIRDRVAQAARRMTMADLLFGLAVTAGVGAAVWALSAAVEAGFWLQTGPRTALFWIVTAICAGLFGYFICIPVLRLLGILPGPSTRSIAVQISERQPELGDRLINLLDLSEGRRSDAPESLVDGAVQMLGREVEPVPFEAAEDFARARRAARIAAFPILAIIVFLTAAPGAFMGASKRLLSPGVHYDRPAPFSLVVEPGSIELARGASMAIRVRPEGASHPRSITLSINNLDEELVEEVHISADSNGVFRHEIANVRKSFRYRVAASPVTSPWFVTTVTEHPLVRNLQVTVQYPAYTGIPPQKLDANVGDVSGLPGSKAQLEVVLGGSKAATARIEFDEAEPRPLEILDGRATGSFTIERPDRYRIVIENDRGVQNRDPISYSIGVVSDASPAIVLLRPEADATLTETLTVDLLARISDDYGFRDLTLHYRLAESRFGEPSETFQSLSIPLSAPRQLDQDVDFQWAITRMTDLDLVPGDVVEYFLRVRDNDSYAGFKAAETELHRLRLPSLAEQYEQLRNEQDGVTAEMENVAEMARQIDQQFQQLRDEIRRKQSADWEDERQIEQLQQQQQRLEQHVDEISRQVESMNDSAQQNNLLSEETLQMYEQMQKVIEEINSPELMEALRQLQEAVEQLNLSQMQQALENIEFNEQQYRDRLERALELFKNLRAQQALEEAARRAEELAKQQERLAEATSALMDEEETESDETTPDDEKQARDEQTDSDRDASGKEDDTDPVEGDERNGEQGDEANSEQRGEQNSRQSDEQDTDSVNDANRQRSSDSPSQEELARQQELSRQEMEQLEQLLEELRQQMDQLQRSPKEEMNRLNESVRQQQLPQQMQENAEQLRQNQLQDAQSGQQQMQQQLQQLQQQLSQMQSGMQGMQMEMNLAGLRRSLSDILTLSKQQEDLRLAIRNNVSEAPSLREDTRRQVELSEGFSTVVDTLQKLAANIPQMSREVQRRAGMALREMSEATESMTGRAVAKAAGHQKASMMHLNELALLLSEVMNQLMNSSGGGGGGSLQQLIQQMQQTAAQQQQLNQEIQQFLNEMQGNRLSIDAQQRLQQMAAQQRAIKQQLDEMRRNPEARGNLLGDLERIAEQMEETIGELERQHLHPRMIERQQQILQRLLDAQRSIHQRGQEDRREAQEGRDILREGPDRLPPEEAVEKLRRDLIRALESGYAPDYEELIKRYFELLQRQRSESE